MSIPVYSSSEYVAAQVAYLRKAHLGRGLLVDTCRLSDEAVTTISVRCGTCGARALFHVKDEAAEDSVDPVREGDAIGWFLIAQLEKAGCWDARRDALFIPTRATVDRHLAAYFGETGGPT